MKAYMPPEKMTVTAHAGAENTKDNSIESIEKALSCGVDAFEIDVNFLDDGKPVITHNKPNESDPTLESVFKLIAAHPGIDVNLDIKSVKNLPAIEKLAKKHGVFERIFFTGIGDDFVGAANSDTPEIPHYLNASVFPLRKRSKKYLLSVAKKVRASRSIGINLHHSGVSREMVEIFHREGLLVSVWTVNDESDMKKIAAMKPDNITTRKPIRLLEIINGTN